MAYQDKKNPYVNGHNGWKGPAGYSGRAARAAGGRGWNDHGRRSVPAYVRILSEREGWKPRKVITIDKENALVRLVDTPIVAVNPHVESDAVSRVLVTPYSDSSVIGLLPESRVTATEVFSTDASDGSDTEVESVDDLFEPAAYPTYVTRDGRLTFVGNCVPEGPDYVGVAVEAALKYLSRAFFQRGSETKDGKISTLNCAPVDPPINHPNSRAAVHEYNNAASGFEAAIDRAGLDLRALYDAVKAGKRKIPAGYIVLDFCNSLGLKVVVGKDGLVTLLKGEAPSWLRGYARKSSVGVPPARGSDGRYAEMLAAASDDAGSSEPSSPPASPPSAPAPAAPEAPAAPAAEPAAPSAPTPARPGSSTPPIVDAKFEPVPDAATPVAGSASTGSSGTKEFDDFFGLDGGDASAAAPAASAAPSTPAVGRSDTPADGGRGGEDPFAPERLEVKAAEPNPDRGRTGEIDASELEEILRLRMEDAAEQAEVNLQMGEASWQALGARIAVGAARLAELDPVLARIRAYTETYSSP